MALAVADQWEGDSQERRHWHRRQQTKDAMLSGWYLRRCFRPAGRLMTAVPSPSRQALRPITGSPPPEKSPHGWKFTGKNPPRQAAARATGKLSAWGDFSGGGRSYNGETFYGAGDILIRGKHINSVIISHRAYFSCGRHFNVTPDQSAAAAATTTRRRPTSGLIVSKLATKRPSSVRDRRHEPPAR